MMSDSEPEKDTRMVCKYGAKCYQKNPAHHKRFKHPQNNNKQKEGKNREKHETPKVTGVVEKFKNAALEDDDQLPETSTAEITSPPKKKQKVHDSGEENLNTKNEQSSLNKLENKTTESNKQLETKKTDADENVALTNVVDSKTFIKEKFLVEMPEDFYELWEFCVKTKPDAPLRTFAEFGLTLVGPYDVLADKFTNIPEKSPDEYLIHWRYYYDPPEFQTVLKGDDGKGFHIGYFRDEPKQLPVFLASNNAKVDGTLEVCGGNIFAALILYLENAAKTNIFLNISAKKFINKLGSKAKEKGWDLSKKNSMFHKRQSKVVTKTFNNIGLVVPYNKKTEMGYRGLALDDKDLKTLLNKLKTAEEEQKGKFLTDLQPVLTYASIATDECDFGTGLELGLNILASGVDSLNNTITRFLSTSYKLLHRDEFAQIIQAHMRNRKKDTHLSIL